MTVYGYARVSTIDQNLDRQLSQLKDNGCRKIYKDKVSGATVKRPQLQQLLNDIKEGDIIIVTDLTRVSRSTRDLFELIDLIKEKGASLKSIKDTWLDTTSSNPYNEFLLTVMAGVSQLERDLSKMRQTEGIEEAKQRGVYKGRPKKYTGNNKGLQYALELFNNRDNNNMTVDDIAEITKISRATIYRAARQQKDTV